MRGQVICRGLPGSWVNGWLAGIGATVLCPGIRLGWTDDRTPRAALSSTDGDPVELLAAAWPTRAALGELPVAEEWAQTPRMERKVSVESFSARVRVARAHPASWTLSSTMTDLHVAADGQVAHAPFDPAGPGSIRWLHDRLLRVHRQVRRSAGWPGPSPRRLDRSLQGTARRVQGSGLGFDITRLASQADETVKRVEPVVEVLAFFGLALFPLRGTGTDARLRGAVQSSALQRGWSRENDRRELCFSWPAWRASLDAAAIDALLDLWSPNRSNWALLGIHSAWRTLRYRPRATADPTRGFGSERL
ncbi:MAG: hypothetical protein F4087_02945 [Gemmatimonadetes bacterium]|nr:hypothetical protein [Gemmatimonadota bacterium]MYE71189.1 hypothetical protein [Gemmatimonadota bacterium]MYJ67458.1 hypothetical protein [Gemmatimonadota bacterium]